MKRLTLFLVLLPIIALSQLSVDPYLGFHSSYMWRGYDLGNGFLATPGATLSVGDNLWFDAWTGINADYQELDLTAAYYFELNDGLGVEFGVVGYTYPGMEDADASYEPFARLYSYDFPMEPSLVLARDITLETTYLEIMGSQTLMEEGLGLELQLACGLYMWDGFTGLSHVQLGMAKEFTFMGLALSPGIDLVLVPQSFIDGNEAPEMNSSEFGLRLEIGLAE